MTNIKKNKEEFNKIKINKINNKMDIKIIR
jgi:hypothetical protein